MARALGHLRRLVRMVKNVKEAARGSGRVCPKSRRLRLRVDSVPNVVLLGKGAVTSSIRPKIGRK